MIILAPTIQHTGSYFLVKHLLADFEQRNLKDGVEDGSVTFDHTLPSKHERWLEIIHGLREKRINFHTIVPLREPHKIFISWQRRGRDFQELIDQVEYMVALQDEIRPLFLPIDHKDRQDYLDVINKATGLNLETDWHIVHGKKDTHNAKIEELEPYRRTYEVFLEKLRPIVNGIYDS